MFDKREKQATIGFGLNLHYEAWHVSATVPLLKRPRDLCTLLLRKLIPNHLFCR